MSSLEGYEVYRYWPIFKKAGDELPPAERSELLAVLDRNDVAQLRDVLLKFEKRGFLNSKYWSEQITDFCFMAH